MIKSPKPGSIDIDLDAQEAIAEEFTALIDRVIEAGWTRMQALTAIGNLADTEREVSDDVRLAPASELPIVSSFD